MFIKLKLSGNENKEILVNVNKITDVKGCHGDEENTCVMRLDSGVEYVLDNNIHGMRALLDKFYNKNNIHNINYLVEKIRLLIESEKG